MNIEIIVNMLLTRNEKREPKYAIRVEVIKVSKIKKKVINL